MVKMNKEELVEELKKIEIEINETQQKQLDVYADFLIEYNKQTNLTAIKEKKDIYLKHFYDSLVLNRYIKSNQKILDIGTGAGFPGCVLALFNPETQFILLDSNNKKIKFLEELIQKLNLKNVELIQARAEDYVKNNLEKFDLVTSRAVAELRILSELSLPALKIGGLFLPLKANITEELEASKETIEILGGHLETVDKYLLPFEKSQRSILIIKHIKESSPIYPRSYDKILKKPLKNSYK